MDELFSLLPLLLFFLIVVVRLARFLQRVFGKIQEKSEMYSKSQKQEKSQNDSRSGPPPGFELDLSEIDDKFGEAKSLSEREESKSLSEREGSQRLSEKTEVRKKFEEDMQGRKIKSYQGKKKKQTGITRQEIGGSEELEGIDLTLNRKNLVQGIIMKEILQSPRSQKPHHPPYLDK
ncbi:MAG: hypothetical protein ACQEQG_00780 [Bacillota bacterium]